MEARRAAWMKRRALTQKNCLLFLIDEGVCFAINWKKTERHGTLFTSGGRGYFKKMLQNL